MKRHPVVKILDDRSLEGCVTERSFKTRHVPVDRHIAAAVGELDEAALIATLQDLVRIRSVFDPLDSQGNETEAANLVCGLLDRWAIPFERWDVAPGRPNVVAELHGGLDGPALIFEGHTDVVTEGERSDWTVDPFGAEIADGKLFGRGSADMKSGLAAMLYAARAIQLSGEPFAGSIRLAILADEEGMMQGAKAFVERGFLDGASGAIICEPEGGRVCAAQKGAIRLHIILHGKMSHGCMPEEGVNTVSALGLVIVALNNLEREIQAEHDMHSTLGRFYLTPTVVQAGTAEQANVVHSRADLFVDVRTCPVHNHEAVIARIKQRVEQAVVPVAEIQMELAVVDDRPATETDISDPVVQAIVDAHEQEFGEVPPFGGVPGSTDGTIFWAANQIPLAVYGPGDTTIPHQADEFVRVDEVIRCARVYISAALRYFDRIGRS